MDPYAPLIAYGGPAVSKKPESHGYKHQKLLKSVVKIFTIKTEPDYTMPWQMKRQSSSTASGFVISGRRIVTNAHALDFQTSVRVRKHGSAEKFIANVVGVGHQCDLAVLSVEDERFWEDVEILQLGDVPQLEESVTVIGYPTGGDNISVTKGVVSRIEETYYSHGKCNLLAIQIDAAINPGNSGGPVFKEDKIVGIAFETLVNADNIGYIIPIPVLLHFLEDIERNKGNYTGFPDVGIQIQAMESDYLRKQMGMAIGQTGVILNKTIPLMHADEVLKKDDIILEIEGTPIGNDGTIPYRDNERVAWRCALLGKFTGDLCNMKIMRNKEIMNVSVKVGSIPYLVPLQQYDIMPTYFVHSGLVFHPITQPYLFQEWGKEWRQKAPIKYVDRALYRTKDFEDQEIVILAQILVDDINVGYTRYAGQVCTKVNGTEIRNMKQLVEIVESNTDSILRFDLEDERVIILDAKEAATKCKKILEAHNIISAKSADLLVASPANKLEELTQDKHELVSALDPVQTAQA